MKTKNFWILFFLIFCLSLTVTLMLPTSVLANGITIEDTVEEGKVLDQNLVLSGPVVVMDGVINGDLLTVGEKVTINGEVNGNLIAAGANVTLNGQVTGSVYISALTLVVGPQVSVGRDVYFFGADIVTQQDSLIKRDLNVISLEADLSGSLGRQVNALIGPIRLIRVIYDFMIEQGWLPLSLRTDVRFFQDSFSSQVVQGMAFGLLPSQNLFQVYTISARGPAFPAGPVIRTPEQGSTIDVDRLQSWAIPTLRNLATLLILGLLFLWLAPAQLSSSGERARTSPWRALLAGLLVFFIGWIILVLLFVLILALALFLFWISLPVLGFFVGALGLSWFGITFSVFWLSIAYFSKIVIAYLVGRLLFKRFIPKYAHSRVWPFLTGVVLYALLASIPYLGWLVAVITTFFGLGALWMLINRRAQSESELSPLLEESGTGNEDPSTVNEEAGTENLEASPLPGG
jgi:hypothetical protein